MQKIKDKVQAVVAWAKANQLKAAAIVAAIAIVVTLVV